VQARVSRSVAALYVSVPRGLTTKNSVPRSKKGWETLLYRAKQWDAWSVTSIPSITLCFASCCVFRIMYRFSSVNKTINEVNNTGVCLRSFYYHYMFRSLWIIIRWSYQLVWITYYSYWKYFEANWHGSMWVCPTIYVIKNTCHLHSLLLCKQQ
jgi:hypothetical protein